MGGKLWIFDHLSFVQDKVLDGTTKVAFIGEGRVQEER